MNDSAAGEDPVADAGAQAQPRSDASGDANRVAVDGLADCDLDDAFDADDPPPGVVAKGGRQLFDLADVLRGAGVSVREIDGWAKRCRSGTGYPASGPAGIIVHHTASSSSWDGQRDVDFMTFGCDVKPMANLYLDRSGTWWVLAAGATNTNGKGGPWGSIPQNGANSRVIGIEAANNGIGERWPDVMQTSYVNGVAALAEKYRIDQGNVLAHHEWAPSRKVDPAGPSRFGSINQSRSWNMTQFRAAVNAARGGSGEEPSKPMPTESGTTSTAPSTTPPKAPPAAGNTHVVQPGDTWWAIATRTLGDPAKSWLVIAAANGGTARVLRPGDVLTIPGAATGTKPPQSAPPSFPGTAKRPDQGPVVLAWQSALIVNGVISECPANRDSHYGDGMFRTVFELQQSWGWSDADGVAGQHTWKKLHGSQ